MKKLEQEKKSTEENLNSQLNASMKKYEKLKKQREESEQALKTSSDLKQKTFN
jgi:hypothetical protein